MNRAEHYLESERMLQTVLEGSAAAVGEPVSPHRAQMIQATFAAQIAIAQVHATLATVSDETERRAVDAGQFGKAQEQYVSRMLRQHPDPAPRSEETL